jgi:O-antigen/teichoic acid export membrane protein
MKALTRSLRSWRPSRGRGNRNRRAFGWGFVSQAFSSATNLGFSLLAGRLLGPSGLGVLFIGFSGYFVVLAFQRASVTQPLIVGSSARPASVRRALAASGITVVVLSGGAAAILFALLGFGVGGPIGRGLLLFAPWLIPSLLQEYWKAILFQEGKGSAGAASDIVRFGATAASALLVVSHRADYMVAASWGLGASAGLGCALASFRTRPKAPRQGVAMWRGEAWSLGRWLGAREVLLQVSSYSTVLALAALLGTTDLGGLRAAQALFSPFSLVAAAFALPALPALSRALGVSRRGARNLAFRISLVATAIGLAYLVVMALIGSWLLTTFFGRSFGPFHTLVWPMAADQLLGAAFFAFGLLLVAERRGLASISVAAANSAATFSLAVLLAWRHGVVGAAWGMAAGAAVGAVAVSLFAMRDRPLRAPTQSGTTPEIPDTS